MSLPIFGAQAAVSILNRVFANTSPANSVFANQVANATASLPAGANSTDVLSYAAFAKSFGTAYATQTPAALSTLMLTNMGLLPNAALATALTDYITAAGVGNVGVVALQLSSILSAMPTSDVNYGAAARAWDTEVTSAFTYSSNAANTSPSTGDVTPPPATQGQTYTLTTATDSLTGTGNDDTFLATAATTGGTFNAADVVNGGAGNDTLTLTLDILGANSVSGATTTGIENISVRNVSGAAQTIAAGNFAGATSFVSDRSVGQLDITGLVAGQAVTVKGNGAVTNGAFNFTHGATVTSGTINIADGTTAGAITQTGAGIASNTINSTGAANTVGAIILSGTVNKTLAINAATALTTTDISGLTAGATITVAGAATSASTGVGVTIGTLDSDVIALNASGLTAGGVSATLNADTTIVVTGGAGNDRITTGAVLTTGTVAAGEGTADRLTLAANTHVNTLTLGNKYSGFEVVGLAAGATQDLALLATNNTLTGLRLAGNATVTNINTATAANVTVTADSTASLGVVGALNPGQIDTVNLTVTDEATAVNTITLTTPVLSGVEILGIVATDNATVTSLGSALALTNVNISGAAATSVTTTAIALQTNFNVNAGTATGNVTFNATGATTNGFSFTGGSGINTVTGGSQVFAANLAASTAKADVITLTNATGGTASLANATVTGFTNSATVTVGDHLELAGVAVIGKAGVAVAAAATTTVATMTGALSAGGIMTFAGTGAATATLSDKISASLEAAYVGGGVLQTVAFEHGGNTYVVESDGTAGYAAGADYVVALVGVTGVTALSTTASGATTLWVS